MYEGLYHAEYQVKDSSKEWVWEEFKLMNNSVFGETMGNIRNR